MSQRRILIGVGAAAVIIGGMTLAPSIPFPPRTIGVQNIENRYSSGGGSKNHLPGAGTKLGDSEDVTSRSHAEQGYGSEKFKKQREEQSAGGNVVSSATKP